MRYSVASLALLVSVFAIRTHAADESPAKGLFATVEKQPDLREIDQLQRQIGELQHELDRLMDRLKSLENSRQPRVLTVPGPSRRPLVHPIPPDWHRREFNGREYFIIPLATDSAAETD